MTTADCTASFRVSKVGVSAAEVTARLGIEPTYAHEVGDPFGQPGQFRQAAMWSISTRHLGIELGPLADHLTVLLDRIEPVRDRLALLHAEGFNMDWFCYVGLDASAGIELDAETLGRLGGLPVRLDLDIYAGLDRVT